MATYADLAARLPEQDRPHVLELSENVLFMRERLIATRRGLAKQDVVMPYDNGGGQTGIRANPAYAEYERLLASYIKTLKALREILAGVSDDDAADANPLASILAEAEKVLSDAG